MKHLVEIVYRNLEGELRAALIAHDPDTREDEVLVGSTENVNFVFDYAEWIVQSSKTPIVLHCYDMDVDEVHTVMEKFDVC